MARTNKYASINFNDIYEKKSNANSSKLDQSSSFTSSSSPATFSSSSFSHQSSLTHHSNSRIHGRMLVLTRPSPPKPQPQQPPAFPSPRTPKSSPAQATPPSPATTRDTDSDQTGLESEPISLRPLGRTGSSLSSPPVTVEKERGGAPAPATFVPPHLRPGFVGREERFEVQNGHGNHHQALVRSHREFGPGRVGEDGRPKSGGGEAVVDVGEVNRRRPSSSGNRSGYSGSGLNGGGRHGYSSSSSYKSPPHY